MPLITRKKICVFTAAVFLPTLAFCQQREIDSILNFLQQYKKEDTVKSYALTQLSYYYQGTNLKMAEKYAYEACLLSQKNNNKRDMSCAMSQLGSVYCWQHRTTEALKMYADEMEIATQGNLQYWEADAYLGMAYVYEVEEDWTKALEYTLKATKKAEAVKNDLIMGFSYNRLAITYLQLDQKTKAVEYCKKAITIFKSHASLDQLGDSYINMGRIYHAQGAYDVSQIFFDSSIQIFERLNEPYQLADVYQNMGEMLIDKLELDEASLSFSKALTSFKQANAEEADLAMSTIGLGVVALHQKKIKEASFIFHQEFEKIKDVGIIDKELECLKYMAAADSAIGNYREAYQHMQEYARLYDTNYNETRARASERMLIEYDVKDKEQQFKGLQEQNENQKRRIAIVSVTGSIILLAIIMLALLYRQKTAALKAINELQINTLAQNRELAVLNNVKDKLLSMIAHDIRSPLTSLQTILQLTREQILNTAEFDHMSQMLDDDITHLVTMLDNTLLWAGEQIQAIKIQKNRFNLYDLTTEVIALYQNAISKKQLVMHNEVPQHTEVLSDMQIIHTVLNNLISNAIKFSENGKNIFINTEQQKNTILLSIKDEGNGMTDEILVKINSNEFISTRGTNNEKGTGLGLLFSKDLLNKLDETLHIKTTPGQGTEVLFTITSA